MKRLVIPMAALATLGLLVFTATSAQARGRGRSRSCHGGGRVIRGHGGHHHGGGAVYRPRVHCRQPVRYHQPVRPIHVGHRNRWSHRCWFPQHSCYGYYCAKASCWYYYYPQRQCYLPVQYISQYRPGVRSFIQFNTTGAAANNNLNQNGPALPPGAVVAPPPGSASTGPVLPGAGN